MASACIFIEARPPALFLVFHVRGSERPDSPVINNLWKEVLLKQVRRELLVHSKYTNTMRDREHFAVAEPLKPFQRTNQFSDIEDNVMLLYHYIGLS